MRRRRGIQSEILFSLATLVVTASGLMVAFLLKTQEVELARVRPFLGRALLEEAQSPAFELASTTDGVHWWLVSGDSVLFQKGGPPRPLDPQALEMARTVAREGDALIRAALPWQPIRFAARAPSAGGVAVARLEPVVAPAAVAGGLASFVGVFTLMGAYLLRRRVVVPLARLEWAAESIAHGETWARVELDEVRETAAVAQAFNDMNEALEERTGDLEKAVADLRGSNERLRATQAGLDRAERLAAVGRLAAGVAHEVGNPMGALLAFLELTRRDGSLSEAGLAHLERAMGQGERVREILRQLLDFSRPPRAERVPVDLVDLARQTVGLVSAQRRYSNIQVDLEAEEGLGPVVADAAMVSQILLNLLLNAADALDGASSPRIALSLHRAPLRVREGEDREASRYRQQLDAVACEVADSGPGIAPEDQERIFDPFFTTKPPGEGTGLGLANAQRLSEELGGVLEVRPSGPLGGAAFVLRLPVGLSGEAPDATGERRERGVRARAQRGAAGGDASS